MPRMAAALAIAVIAAACSTSTPPSPEAHAGHSAGASPSGSADPHAGHDVGDSGASGTPHPSAPEGADGTIVLADELAVGGAGLSIAESIELASSQPVLVNGFLLRDADGAIWFCPAVAKGDDPPACGHPTLSVINFPPDESVFEPENARGTGSQTEAGVTWIPNQQLYGVVHPAP